MKIKHNYLFSIFLLFVLILQTTASVQGETLLLIPKKDYKSNISATEGNNIYLKGDPSASILNPDFFSSQTEFDLYGSVDNQRDMLRSVQRNDPVSLTPYNAFTNGIIEFQNTTNSAASIKYEAGYYDLTNSEEDLNELKDVVVYPNQKYGFKFDGIQGEPVALSILTESATALDIIIIGPNGMMTSVHRHFESESTGLIPIVPDETGEYTVMIIPKETSSGKIIKSLKLLGEFDVKEFTEAKKGTIKSQDSKIEFYKYIPSGSALSLDQTVKTIMNINFEVTLDSVYYSGGVVVFNKRMNDVLGSSTGLELVTNQEIIFAVLIQSPTNAGKEINEHFYGKDLKMDYVIWIDELEIPNLELGTDFYTTPQAFPSSSNYYYFKPSGDTSIIGMNGSGFFTATLFDVNDETNMMEISSFNNDLLNSPTDDLVIVNSEYVVKVPRNIFVRFTEASVQSGSSWELRSKLNDVDVLFVENSESTSFAFNFTLKSQIGMSVSFSVNYFSAIGEYATFSNVDLRHIENEAGTYSDVFNETMKTPSVYSPLGFYVRVKQTSNSVYNISLPTPVVTETNNQRKISILKISSFDYFAYLNRTNPDLELIKKSLAVSGSQNYQETLFFDKDIYVMITLDLVEGAYLVDIDTYGREMIAILFAVDLGNTFSITSTMTVINSTKLFTEFAVSNSMKIGILILIPQSTSGEDRELILSIKSLSLTTLPSLDLGLIATSKQKSEKSKDKGLPLEISSTIVAFSVLMIAYQIRRKMKK